MTELLQQVIAQIEKLPLDSPKERLLVLLALAQPAVGTALPLALRSRSTPTRCDRYY